MMAPKVMPNKAIEMAKNAKWYHMVALKMRVSRFSNIKIDNVVANKPR